MILNNNIKIKVIIAHSGSIVRKGLKSILDQCFWIEEIHETSTMSEIMKILKPVAPDVLILDFDFDQKNLTDVIVKIKRESAFTKILVISPNNDQSHIMHAINNGANGFLTQDCDADEIIGAISTLINGEKYFSNNAVKIIINKSLPVSKLKRERSLKLTSREIEVVKHVAKGLTNKEIAGELFLSHHTVHTHRKNIMKKLGINSASGLALYAVNEGIIDMSEVMNPGMS